MGGNDDIFDYLNVRYSRSEATNFMLHFLFVVIWGYTGRKTRVCAWVCV